VTRGFGWRAGFWFIAIVYLGVTGLAWFCVPNDVEEKKVKWNAETVRKLDLEGTGLAILGIGMFVAALSLGADAEQGWKTPYVLVLLVLGVVFIGAFLVWECRYPDAMIPMNIWKDRDFSLVRASSRVITLHPLFGWVLTLYLTASCYPFSRHARFPGLLFLAGAVLPERSSIRLSGDWRAFTPYDHHGYSHQHPCGTDSTQSL